MRYRSNTDLSAELIVFCQKHLQPLGYKGYYRVDWAGSAGSNRVFYRIRMPKDETFILVEWPGDDHDWDYFLALQEIESLENLVPALVGMDRSKGLLLMTDCGVRSLKDLFHSKESDVPTHKLLLEEVLVRLFYWQSVEVPQNSHIQKRHFDQEALLWETDYFQTHITALIPELAPLFDEQWQRERKGLATRVAGYKQVLMHRDFQAENIVLNEGVVRFIDVQGVRIGPGEYDIASLLYDPYLSPLLTKELRSDMVDLCIEHSGDSTIKERIYYSALQRLMQALGAYGNLSLNMDKPRYRTFVAPALANLWTVLEELPLGTVPQLRTIVAKAIEYWDTK